jgi:hypothetical protein
MRLFKFALICAAISDDRNFAQRASDHPGAAIPKTWDEGELEAWTLRARIPGVYPVHLPSKPYYQIPAPPIYRSYPIYHPSKEPPGYLDWLRRQEPQVVFDAAKLHTRADWEAADKLVFQSRFCRCHGCQLQDGMASWGHRYPQHKRIIGIPRNRYRPDFTAYAETTYI